MQTSSCGQVFNQLCFFLVRHQLKHTDVNKTVIASFLNRNKWPSLEEVYITGKFNVCQLPVFYLSIPEKKRKISSPELQHVWLLCADSLSCTVCLLLRRK